MSADQLSPGHGTRHIPTRALFHLDRRDRQLVADMVHAFVASVDEVGIDDDPDLVIARTVDNVERGGYGPRAGALAAVADELGQPWPPDPALLAAGAAGRARWALIQRDRAIRTAVVAGHPLRQVAGAVNMTGPGVARVAGRDDQAGRW